MCHILRYFLGMDVKWATSPVELFWAFGEILIPATVLSADRALWRVSGEIRWLSADRAGVRKLDRVIRTCARLRAVSLPQAHQVAKNMNSKRRQFDLVIQKIVRKPWAEILDVPQAWLFIEVGDFQRQSKPTIRVGWPFERLGKRHVIQRASASTIHLSIFATRALSSWLSFTRASQIVNAVTADR